MKYLLPLFFSALLLVACSKSPDPTPPTVVAVHYTAGGSAMQFRGRVDVGNLDHAGVNPGNYFTALVTSPTLDATREIVTNPPAYLDDYDLTVKVSLVGAERGSTVALPPGSFVQAEILVNGQVRKTARVDETTVLGPLDLYPRQTAALPFKGL